jgi:hypothetical protein
MLEGKRDEPSHMLIGQTVVKHHPLAPIRDEAEAAEKPKLVTHRRLACPERGRQITDAKFPLREGPEDLQTTPLPKRLEEIGETFSLLDAQSRVLGSLNQLAVDDPATAPVFPLPSQTTPAVI